MHVELDGSTVHDGGVLASVRKRRDVQQPECVQLCERVDWGDMRNIYMCGSGVYEWRDLYWPQHVHLREWMDRINVRDVHMHDALRKWRDMQWG